MSRHAVAAALAAALALGASFARADELDLFAVDKEAHVAVSYGLSLSGTLVLRRAGVPRWQSVAIAAAATLALGAFKELALDDPGSWGDMGANTLGVAGSAAFVFALEL
jgi:hypothetical protein